MYFRGNARARDLLQVSAALRSDGSSRRPFVNRMLFGLVVTFFWATLTVAWFLYPNAAADVYDFLIVKMTAVWYRAVFERVEGGSRILDVGVGTGSALVRNKDLVQQKRLVIVGIDYEMRYIKKATEVVAAAGLSELVKLNCQSIYEPKLRQIFSGAAKFDCAYFSGSITLMPDPPAALKCAATMLVDGGLIYVTQTFQNQPSPIAEKVKPLLRRFTSVDFGRVTYYKEVADIAAKAGMQILEDKPVPGSIDNANQTARLLVLKPYNKSQ